MNTTIQWTRLPFKFDVARLKQDSEKIEPSEWVSHFNQGDYSGNWSGVALRSPSGSASDIYPKGGDIDYRDAELLERCPYFCEVLQNFPFPLKAVRLLRLQAGSRIREHKDPDLRFEEGELRIHIPIETNAKVEFIVAGRRLILEEGTCWYIDFSQPHRIHNRGETNRTHLVIDGLVNDWIKEIVLNAAAQSCNTTSLDEPVHAFHEFRKRVFVDENLQTLLLAEAGNKEFFLRTVELGKTLGYDFDIEDVDASYRDARRLWMEKRTTA